ncbi:hypothetical protein TNCV_2277871 [Trichonephila clavipes]|nr:hypothetical protein TNCV_2277871 [Trichonephila clavipes]
MPTCFTMVVSLSTSNCPLPAFRRMGKIRKGFAIQWTPPTSPLHQKTGEPTNTSTNVSVISLKSHLPGSVPLEYLSFCSRGKFCDLAQGNRGLIVVKESDQRKIFEKLGLFTINLETLPHFRDFNDRCLPDHLHDEVH